MSGQKRSRMNSRDEARQAAADLVPVMLKRIQSAVKGGEMLSKTADDLTGMVKNFDYQIDLSRREAAFNGGGIRDIIPGQAGYATQPAVLRLVERAGR